MQFKIAIGRFAIGSSDSGDRRDSCRGEAEPAGAEKHPAGEGRGVLFEDLGNVRMLGNEMYLFPNAAA